MAPRPSGSGPLDDLADGAATPPHLARPELRYVADDQEDFLRAVSRGFHEDYSPDSWRLESDIVEDDRNFGFQVDGRWISTCGAFSRAMTVPGGAQVPVAAVTIVSVSSAYRRRGLLTQMMTHQLQEMADRGTEPVALLWASETSIYGRFGYGHAAPRLRVSGSTDAATFLSAVPRSDGSVGEVTKQTFLKHAPGLHVELLAERPGALQRSPGWWNMILDDSERRRRGASSLRYLLCYDAAGAVDGFAYFRVKGGYEATGPTGEVQVMEVQARTPAGYAALWRFQLDLDLVRRFVCADAAVDEPLRYLVADQRAIQTELVDGTFARLVDLPTALAARRYAAEVDTVIEVDDSLLPGNRGRWRLQAGADGASVTRATRSPDLSLDIQDLGTVYLGGTLLTTLQRAGRVREHTSGAAVSASNAFGWDRPPFCPDHF